MKKKNYIFHGVNRLRFPKATLLSRLLKGQYFPSESPSHCEEPRAFSAILFLNLVLSGGRGGRRQKNLPSLKVADRA